MAEYQPIQYAYTQENVIPQLRVTGLREVIAMLEGLPRGLVAEGFTRAFHEAGEVLQDELQRQTPVRMDIGKKVVTGTKLAQSLRHRVVIDSQYRGGFVQIDWGSMSWVANLVEYGHAMVTHYENTEAYTDRKGKKRFKKWGGHEQIGTVRPHPFIRPSGEVAFPTAIERFVDSIAKTTDNYVAKYGTGKAA
jgi:hypothetical protein